MSWSFGFGLANWLAIACWAALVLLPRGDLLKTVVFYVGIGLLCLAYALLVVLLMSGALTGNPVDGAGPASYNSIEGVRNIFMSDGGVVVGWIHYLAFDLFVGLWIARDADHKGFSRWLQAPVLLVTFLFGPLGLLIWLFIREPAARRAAKKARQS